MYSLKIPDNTSSDVLTELPAHGRLTVELTSEPTSEVVELTSELTAKPTASSKPKVGDVILDSAGLWRITSLDTSTPGVTLENWELVDSEAFRLMLYSTDYELIWMHQI